MSLGFWEATCSSKSETFNAVLMLGQRYKQCTNIKPCHIRSMWRHGGDQRKYRGCLNFFKINVFRDHGDFAVQ